MISVADHCGHRLSLALMVDPPYVGPMTPTAALQLAEDVVVDGFGPHRAALADLVAEARRRGVSPAVVGVAADPAAPAVARARALGRLVGEYCRLVEADARARDMASATPSGATAA